MTERLRRPLDPAAVRAADDAFYAEHPEMIVDGTRRPISRSDPRFADQAAEWRASYAASLESAQAPADEAPAEEWASPTRAVESPAETCPLVWIAVELQYEDDQAPFASERYEMVLPDSQTQRDTLSGGRVYVDKILPGACSIRFVDWKNASA